MANDPCCDFMSVVLDHMFRCSGTLSHCIVPCICNDKLTAYIIFILGQQGHPCLVYGFRVNIRPRNSFFSLVVFPFSIFAIFALIDTATAVCELVPMTWYGHRRAVPCIAFPASVAIPAR